MKAPKDERFSFSNHLSVKLESRKNERKQKKLLKKQRGGKKDKFEKLVELTNGNQVSYPSQKKKKRKRMDSKTRNKPSSSKINEENMKKMNKSEENTKGFQLSSSNNERMARLQEFVNQESGKINNPSKKETKKNNAKDTEKERQKGNLIKNKKKLESIKRDQEDDTLEINRLGKLLKWNKTQKQKVAFKFADDIGDILADIEEGSMKRASGYSDKNENQIFKDSSDSESVESDSDSDLANDDMKMLVSKPNGKSKSKLGNTKFVKDNHNKESYSDEKSSDDQGFYDSEMGYDSEDEGDFLNSNEEDHSEEDSDSEHCFLDKEAEECSEEESDNDMPVHDDTKEYELAFEGGGQYYQKPEPIIDNGAIGYSSNSDDDTDLDGFIVDDDHVEYESSDATDDDKSLLQIKKLKKRRRVICQDDDEDDHTVQVDSEVELESNGKRKRGKLRLVSESDYSSAEKKTKRKRILVISDDEEVDTNIQDEEKVQNKRKNLNKALSVTNENESDSPAVALWDKKLCLPNDPGDAVDKSKTKKKKKIFAKEQVMGNIKSNIDHDESTSKELKKKKKKNVLSEEPKENINTTIAADESTSKKLKKKKKKKNVLSEEPKENINSTIAADESTSKKPKKKKKKKNVVNEESTEDINSTTVADESTSEKPEMKKKRKKKKSKLNKGIADSEVTADRNSGNSDLQDFSGKVTEDIYGRLRDKEGNIIEQTSESVNGKYIPPALRKLMSMNIDEKKKEELARLKRTVKGLLNRLAESNMAGIASQIEGMYQKHSHNDMNECLCELYMDSLVAPTLTPERLVQEHALLVAVLSANVGNQVGAHMLTEFVLKLYDEIQEKSSSTDVGCKRHDNMLLLIANLFNFKVINAKIIYDILQRLADVFTEKEVELILLILRTVGFALRKEDPLSLKTFITQIQAQAASHQAKNSATYTRICFMLEVIHSIKNNNPAKVPNYDPSHVQHLKKLIKGLIHKGSTLSPLHVNLSDILNSKSQGRWWIVGSAWSGGLKENELPANKTAIEHKKEANMEDEFSEHFKMRAAKLHLTRPPRINIMYIITEGSEDYLDAFDKLLQLKLPANQEQEIFNVILLCCQKSKVYNEFFSHLAIRICKFDKRYKRILQFAVWDKFKEIENCKPRDLENLAKFLVHLIGEDALYITVLKTLSFVDVDEGMVNFIKIVLKDLLLHTSGSEKVLQIFSKISAQPELLVFSQSLRIFIAKFIISKKKKDKPKYQILYTRSQEVLELLSMRGGVAL